MASSFVVRTRTRHSAEALFDLSLDIGAHVSSMAATDETAIGGVTAGRIGLGESVTWRARHLGLTWRMTSRITALDRPHRFVDEQVAGPFRSFRHVHLFERRGGVTLMTDLVRLESPVLGRVAERVVLVPHLRRLIGERNRALLRMLDAAERAEQR
ncbi:hypothetical protein GCM10010988_05300 [Cnuibacter physcomitrellae]|uniref:Cyclase n=1 Tax=Cnuibacter physcomitrellae TaxID=1619308 RepID=A0A1X9LJR4_9MICO|nr:SRPBCC family protein [Cnuibacter physcomitrellae]ARJ05445.1 cyclase [Cnuibacter physcomitrellae]GGI35707.1 hypothetical protein GCM10010988_05300 [Cnuibacter physcomitrellae]